MKLGLVELIEQLKRELEQLQLAAEAMGEYKNQQVNTIKLTLKPLGSASAVKKAVDAGEVVCWSTPTDDPMIG